MSARFECPRCQHVFSSDADQAFAECPECGSLALPREVSAEGGAVDDGGAFGDATAASGPTLSSSDDGFSASSDAFAAQSIAQHPSPSEFAADTQVAPAMPSGLDSGIFAGLLPEEPSAEMPPGALHSDPGSDPIYDATQVGPAVPSSSELPPSVALTRSVEGDPAPAPEPEASLPPSVALTRSLEGDPVDEAGGFESAATRTYASPADPASLFGGAEEEHSDDFDPFKGIELPSGGDSVDLSVPPEAAAAFSDQLGGGAEGPTMKVAALADPDDEDDWAAGTKEGTPPEMSLDDRVGGSFEAEATAVGPAPTAMSDGAGAVTLSELERQLPEGTPIEMFNLGAGADLFGEEAFGDLERAFDDVASRPDMAPIEPRTTKTAEELVEEAIAAQLAEEAAYAQGSQAPRPPGGPSAPPLRLRKQGRVPHLTLTQEAIDAAAVPVLSKEVSGLHLTPSPASDPFNEVNDSPNVNFLEEETDIVMRRPSASGSGETRVVDAAAASSEGEPTPSPSAITPIEGETRLLSGFTFMRVAAAAFLFAILGAVVGGMLAPNEADKPRTKSDRAREIYAKGNRFYEEGRFDDALGDYRSALAIDPSFTPALRAKGAALAKQRRYKEAAQAYEEYLAREPDAYDASQVEEVLARYKNDDGADDT